MRFRRAVATALLLPALLGAATPESPSRLPGSEPAASASAPLSPSVVLQRYVGALARVSPPRALVFDYTVEQAGLLDIEQKHRIYRGRGIERDELTEIDGRKLLAPSVRVTSGEIDRYDILSVAPRPDRYGLAFVTAQRAEGHLDYFFRAVSRTPRSFSVDGVTIDGQSFLPSVVLFHTAGAARASGRLSYGRFSGHWLIREASVNAVMANKPVREYLLWTAYQFPTSLPPLTFTSSRSRKGVLTATRAFSAARRY
jgi:hypothetical protein